MPVQPQMLFWKFLCLLILALGLSACAVALILCSQPNANTHPSDTFLGGSPGFALLAIVVAFSAYLRNVAVTAEEKSDEIITNDKSIYRVNKEIRKEKLDALAASRINLQVAAPFLIFLSVIVAVRLLAESFGKMGLTVAVTSLRVLHVVDFLILEYLLLVLLVLGRTHHLARVRDELIRDKALLALGPHNNSSV